MSFFEQVELDSTFTIDKPKSNGPHSFSVEEYLLEDGSVMSFPIVHAIQTSMAQDTSLDHEYLPIAGLESFTKASMKLILGNTSPVVENRVVTIQTLSDVGGLRVAAEFLNKFLRLNVVSIPNTMPKEVHEVFESRGYIVHTIPYWNETKKTIDLEAIKYHLSVLNDGGLVLLENCGRNWSGDYLSESEWNEIIKIILEKNLFLILNAAQDGLCYTDLKNDHYPARKLADHGAEFIVTQSFDRSLGLYSERVGSMTLVVKESREIFTICWSQTERIFLTTKKDTITMSNCKSQVERIIRALYSNPPSHGARIVSYVLNNASFLREWKANLKLIRMRLKSIRKELFEKLRLKGTPGRWDHLLRQRGLYSALGLTRK